MCSPSNPLLQDESQASAWLMRADQDLQARNLLSAQEAFTRAQSLGAPADRCRAGRWTTAMLGGHFELAWKETDAIRNSGGDPDPYRLWEGDDIRGVRVIVRCLHGLGDAVQMLQYAPLLHTLALRVIVEVPPPMLQLGPYFRGVDQVITWGPDAPAQAVEWDVQAEAIELPHLFRTQLNQLPLATHYLELPQALLSSTALRMGARQKPRVGFVWAGGDWNPQRSIPLRAMQPLLDLRNLEMWSLQGGAAAQEIRGQAVKDATQVCGDGLLALAATISALDLVITTDTLAAHLAGSLGKPVWVMLQHAADWRWMIDREDSPWYPSMQLFRQPAPGDWNSIVEAIRSKLEGWQL